MLLRNSTGLHSVVPDSLAERRRARGRERARKKARERRELVIFESDRGRIRANTSHGIGRKLPSLAIIFGDAAGKNANK